MENEMTDSEFERAFEARCQPLLARMAKIIAEIEERYEALLSANATLAETFKKLEEMLDARKQLDNDLRASIEERKAAERSLAKLLAGVISEDPGTPSPASPKRSIQ
jgi:hypothetical protein